jgi:hypothetical protein
MAAIDALKATHQIEILITRVYNSDSGDYGVALACISWVKRPLRRSAVSFYRRQSAQPCQCWSQHSLIGVGRINHIHWV